MASFAGVAEGLGNLATGGILDALTKKKTDQPLPDEDLYGKDVEDLKKIAAYDPGIMSKLGNLLTGGLLGEATGTNALQRRSNTASDLIREEELEKRKAEIEKRLLDRMAMKVSPQPFTPMNTMQGGAFTQNDMAPVTPNYF